MHGLIADSHGMLILREYEEDYPGRWTLLAGLLIGIAGGAVAGRLMMMMMMMMSLCYFEEHFRLLCGTRLTYPPHWRS
jgi:hypothetical protein